MVAEEYWTLPHRIGIILILLAGLTLSQSPDDHWARRTKILSQERRQSLGGSLVLTAREINANTTLMAYKEAEWLQGFERPGEYPPNMHFFHGKAAMEKSTVFRIIQQMPKGVLLHTHDFGMVSLEYLMNLTYTPDLYVCDESKIGLKFKFLKSPNGSSCSNDSGWQLLADLRKTSENIDDRIRKTLSLIVDDPHRAYPNIDAVWAKFQKLFITVSPILTYKPVFEKYFLQALTELYDDNIRYVQVRTTLPDLYDLEGAIYKNSAVVKTYKEVTEVFKRKHERFLGVKLIYAPPRHVTNETMGDYIEIYETIKGDYKEFVLGFDLVGQEDKGVPLKDFLDHLLPLKRKNCNFFFHAGETDWYGAATDENLVDAILLGTQRVGHGYAILKHPLLLQTVRQNGIALEVSPISNQVLRLVEDIRNHPGAVLGALGMPMVVTNDDPTFWGAKGVSYDWYMAYMGMASRHSDLAYLKQLALNSIKYSGLETDVKTMLYRQWVEDWQLFIQKLAADEIH